MTRRVAALFVEEHGAYANLRDVEVWGISRDARLYCGPYPVVCHSPCERWGRYWSGGPSAIRKRVLGDDGGCFAAALAAVRCWGGVLEHPEASHAFRAYGLVKPQWRSGWIPAGDKIGHVCCVAQGHYGHRARKLTWLYAVGVKLPELDWSIPRPRSRLDYGFHSAAERVALRDKIAPIVNRTRLHARENLATPSQFRDILIAMARTSGGASVHQPPRGGPLLSLEARGHRELDVRDAGAASPSVLRGEGLPHHCAPRSSSPRCPGPRSVGSRGGPSRG